jgi:hypothetical protein
MTNPMFGSIDSHSKDLQSWGTRTLFKIPAPCLPRFEKELAKLSKRSEKLTGFAITHAVIGRETKNHGTPSELVIYDVFLLADTPVIDGWVFVARIDHSNETGNIVRTVPNLTCEIPEVYRTASPDCDHCKMKRKRRDTFVLWNPETNEFQQVGSSCLIDFFGHDPYKIARLAEMLGFATEIAAANQDFDESSISLADRRWINVEDFLGYVAMTIRTRGWVSGGMAFRDDALVATRVVAFGLMMDNNERPSADDTLIARNALEWARDLAMQDDLNDYLHNINVVAGSTYCEHRSLGLAASIVPAYQRSCVPTRAKSETWIGEPGKKIRGRVVVERAMVFDTMYGRKTMYIFRTDSGAVIKWSTTVSAGLSVGETVVLSGKVKDHETYKGEKQTTVTHCSFDREMAHG